MSSRRLIWVPRIFAIVFILFISLFSLDSFSGDVPLQYQIGGFIVHLLPSFLLTLILAVAWKNPSLGGCLFLVLSLVFTAGFGWYQSPPALLLLLLPLAFVGSLFIVIARLDSVRTHL